MKIQTRFWTVAGIVLLVSGCSYTDAVFGGRAPRIVLPPGLVTSSSASPAAAAPPTGSAAPDIPDLSPGMADPGPGSSAAELRAVMQRLDSSLSAHQQEMQRIGQKLDQDQVAYMGLVAAIKAGLRPGAAPGGTRLVDSWGRAETALDRMTDDLAALAALSRVAERDGQLATQLGERVQALSARAPASPDASRSLAQLGNQIEAQRGRSDTLLDALKSNLADKTAFVSNQRGSMSEALLAIRDLSGGGRAGSPAASPASRIAAAVPSPPSPPPSSRTPPSPPAPPAVPISAGAGSMAEQPPSGFGDRRPFVVIRFDRPDVAYEDALAIAVKRALARQADISFDVAAIAANDGTAAGLAANTEASKQHLAAVVRSLIGLGVPFQRIILSASSVAGLASNEIRIYVH